MFPLYYCRNATSGWLLSDERPFDAQDLRAQVHHGQESMSGKMFSNLISSSRRSLLKHEIPVGSVLIVTYNQFSNSLNY